MTKKMISPFGSSTCNIKQAVAGALADFQVKYIVGKTGIDDGGVIKVLFRISTDIADVQFVQPDNSNYVTFESNNKKVTIEGYSRTNGLKGKVDIRPWTNGFVLFIKGASLKENDHVTLKFKKFRMQTFTEKTFEFKIAVDSYATGKFYYLKNNPTIQIVPGPPVKLVIISPTTVLKRVPFSSLIKLEDLWGNPCANIAGKYEYKFSDEKSLTKISFTKGKALIKKTIHVSEDTTFYLQGTYKNIHSTSNPIVVSPSVEPLQYWADLHGQSEETVGTNSLNDYFLFAKNYSLLNVAVPQSNDFQIDNLFWNKTLKECAKYSKGNDFIVLPGYEWSGKTSEGGDRNIIFESVQKTHILRSSNVLVSNSTNPITMTGNVEDLFSSLNPLNTLMIAHVGGRYANLDIHDERIEPLVEIHSCWGTFEWFFHNALEKGYQVGVTAGSDTHNGRPGASYPGLEEFNSYGGLTCILSNKLDSKSIFNALKQRHTYATSGKRIYLQVYSLDKNNKVTATMGDILTSKNQLKKIFINVKANSQVEKIELYNKSTILKEIFPLRSSRIKTGSIKIVWTGTSLIGKKREYSWRGTLKMTNNKIVGIEKINDYSKFFLVSDDNTISFNTFTTGNTQGLILKTKNFEKGQIVLKLNEKIIEINVNDLSKRSFKYKIADHSNIEIYATSQSDNVTDYSDEFEIQDANFDRRNALFTKVTFRDGHFAWSSPIFV